MKETKNRDNYISNLDTRLDSGPHEIKPLIVKATFSLEQIKSFFKRLFRK